MKSFTFYQSFIQLETEQSIMQNKLQLRFVFSSTGVLYSSLKKHHLEMKHNLNCRAREFQANRMRRFLV